MAQWYNDYNDTVIQWYMAQWLHFHYIFIQSETFLATIGEGCKKSELCCKNYTKAFTSLVLQRGTLTIYLDFMPSEMEVSPYTWFNHFQSRIGFD